MSKWINRFLKKEFQNGTDKTDKPRSGGHLSVLSVLPEGPFGKNLGNTSGIATDKPNGSGHLSVLSVPPGGPFGKKLGNMGGIATDKTDNPRSGGHLPVLSVPSGGPFDKNLENTSGITTDKTDKPNGGGHLSVLSVPPKGAFGKSSLLDDFEERLAIAEYDGHQNSTQAQRIAYQDAFISVLNTLPYESIEGGYEEDWLGQKIKATKNWLVSQGLLQPK